MPEPVRRLGLGVAPTLGLVALILLLAPDDGMIVMATTAAALLLLVAGHLLIDVAALPFLALGAMAQLGAWIVTWLTPLAGPPAALAFATVTGALLLTVATPLLARSSLAMVAGTTLALAGVASLTPAVPPTALPLQTPGAGMALAVALLGLLLGDRLSRSSVGLALAAVRARPGLAGLSGAEPGGLMLAPIAAAGLMAAASGGIVALTHAPSAQALAAAAPASSVAVAVAVWAAGGRGLGMVMLAGLPLVVAPSAALLLWPGGPDLQWPLAALTLVVLLAWRARRHDAA
jgi:hypothetical protein